MKSIGDINATNLHYKNIKSNNFDHFITKLNANNYIASSNFEELISNNETNNQLYLRMNRNISDSTVYQPKRSEQIEGDISNKINIENGIDNKDFSSLNSEGVFTQRGLNSNGSFTREQLDFQGNSLEKDNRDNRYKYRITRINIDSKNRNISPKNIIANSVNSNLSNPFSFQKNINIMTINYQNHGLLQNDKITISNLNGSEYNLREFNIMQNSYYVKISHQNHGMIPFPDNVVSARYQILISGITNYNSTFIQNIPLNVLNGYHYVYFNTDEFTTFDPNYYYIKIQLQSNQNITFTTNYKVTYLHLYGIPLSSINANYPINASQNNGFQIVHNIIDSNNFQIQLDYVASTTITSCGGNNISVNKIIDFIEGYPNNNHYIISLNKTFYNVSKLRLVSSEFPNTDKIIRDTPMFRQNNLLFWQSLNDGETIYKITLTPGNYNVSNLCDEINNQVSTVNIANANITSGTTYNYSKTFRSETKIDINNNIFSIKFFGVLNIQNPFNINTNSANTNIYYLTVNHPNHLLQVGTKITIQNSTSIGIVPDYIINTDQTIYSIIDANYYTIQLNQFNILSNNSNIQSGGGNAVQIIYPYITRLLFNQVGTIGNLLGFRNVGEPDSILQWSYNNTNNEPYVNDILTDVAGIPITSSTINKYINLNGDNYLIISNPLLKNTVDTGGINGVFAKILLAGPPGYVLFNQYIQLGDEFNEGIQSLSELEFFFYASDGTLYEFNGLEHSMTVEIYEKIIYNIHINNSTRL